MPAYRADVIVVLGTAIDVDGAPTPLARQRVERAAALLAAHVAPRVIFSGRCNLMSTEAPAITEAAGMAAYAERLGVPRERILLEEESQDTIGNAYFVHRRYLEPNGWTALRIVTSDFHVPRTTWVFQKLLGSAYDVSFSPASSELDATIIAARARAEGDIITYLMEWIGTIPDGDRDAVERLIWEQHPGYATAPTVSKEKIRRRVEEIGRVHRVIEASGLRGYRRTDRDGEEI